MSSVGAVSLRQRALQIRIDESLVEHGEPHPQRDRRRIAALAAQEIRIDRASARTTTRS